MADSVTADRGGVGELRVALFDVDGKREDALKDLTAILGSLPRCTWKPVGPGSIRHGVLDQFDVVVFPGGSGRRQAEALGKEGCEAVCDFVWDGGGYVGICGGGFLATANYNLGILNAKALAGTIDVPGEGPQPMAARGVGDVEVDLTAAGSRLFATMPGHFSMRYTGGPILSPGGKRGLPTYVVLAEYRSEVWQWEPQRGTMVNTPAMVAAPYGQGRVVVFSAHPEMAKQTAPLFATAVLATARELVRAKND